MVTRSNRYNRPKKQAILHNKQTSDINDNIRAHNVSAVSQEDKQKRTADLVEAFKFKQEQRAQEHKPQASRYKPAPAEEQAEAWKLQNERLHPKKSFVQKVRDKFSTSFLSGNVKEPVSEGDSGGRRRGNKTKSKGVGKFGKTIEGGISFFKDSLPPKGSGAKYRDVVGPRIQEPAVIGNFVDPFAGEREVMSGSSAQRLNWGAPPEPDLHMSFPSPEETMNGGRPHNENGYRKRKR